MPDLGHAHGRTGRRRVPPRARPPRRRGVARAEPEASTLHRTALAALADPPSGAPELARLAHHAEAAGDAEAVLALRAGGRRSARRRSARTARRPRSTRGRSGSPTACRRGAGASCSSAARSECYLTDQNDEAIEAIERRARVLPAARRPAGGGRRAALALGSSSGAPAGHAEADAAGREAVALLERLPPGRELAMAYANLALPARLAARRGRTRHLGAARDRARGAPRRHRDRRAMRASTHSVPAEAMDGRLGGAREPSLELAQAAGLDEQVGHASTCSLWRAVPRAPALRAREPLPRGRASSYCSEHGLELLPPLPPRLSRSAASSTRAAGSEAADSAAAVAPRAAQRRSTPRTVALVVLGARPGAARRSRSSGRRSTRRGRWRSRPASCRGLGAGRGGARRGRLARRRPRGRRRGNRGRPPARRASGRGPWLVGELADWRRRAGIGEELPARSAEPYALQLAGDWARAAELWRAARLPLRGRAGAGRCRRGRAAAAGAGRAAAARAPGRPPRSSRAGCGSAARGGCRAGPRPATRRTRPGLTARELEVLALLAQGLRNAEIADRLVLSPRRPSTTTSRRSCASSASGRAARRAPRPCGSGSPAKIGSLPQPGQACRCAGRGVPSFAVTATGRKGGGRTPHGSPRSLGTMEEPRCRDTSWSARSPATGTSPGRRGDESAPGSSSKTPTKASPGCTPT